MGRELEPAGVLMADKTFKFAFNKFEKQFESYYGVGVKLRYLLRVSILKNYKPKIIEEFDFAVFLPQEPNDSDERFEVTPETLTHKLDVGIEDCLHIEFEYNSQSFHLKDVLKGTVRFKLVRIRIKHMFIDLLKKEVLGVGANPVTETETVTKFEVMDGCPVKDEEIPVRLFFSGSDVSPTQRNVNGKFSVKFFLNLVLVDDEDRRYFKQQEITFWRKK